MSKKTLAAWGLGALALSAVVLPAAGASALDAPAADAPAASPARPAPPRPGSRRPALAAEITRGTFAIDAEAVPLAEVGKVWSDRDRRVVLVPRA